MKGKKSFMQELSWMTVKEIVLLRKKMRMELHTLRMKHAISGLKQTHQLGDLKVKIARAQTVLTRKISENNDNSMK